MEALGTSKPQVPRRVLHVFASLDRGGAETVVMNWYREIDRETIQFDFVVEDRYEPYSYAEEVQELGGRVYELPRLHIGNLRAYRRAWIELLHEHPEWGLVHVHHAIPSCVYLPIFRRVGIPRIIHSHSAGDLSLRGIVKRIAMRPLRHMATRTAACSQAAAHWMFGNAGADVIIPNAIDVSAFTPLQEKREKYRAELQIEDRFVVGHVGRFNYPKNHEKIVRVFQKLKEMEPRTALVLVGQGSLRKTVELQMKEAGLEQDVFFLGAITDIPGVLSLFDVFLFPSRYEGLGLAVVEAQASGLVCVIADSLPAELDLTECIVRLPLSADDATWARTLLAVKGEPRKVTASQNQIRSAGYGLKEGTKKLVALYDEVSRPCPPR